MPLKLRSYAGAKDWAAITALIRADPRFHHPLDFPWRLCATSLEDHRNAAIWEDESGQMKAFAALQFAWITLDYAIHPTIRTWDLEAHILDWGETRLRQIAEETGDKFPFNVTAFGDEHERIAHLEERGYTRWENFLVMFNRPLQPLNSATEPSLPPGFIIRPLAGESEVAQYAALHRAAFESNTMTTMWRQRTLRVPLYDPALDLVVVSPDGRLAGFCIWWYHPTLKMAQIEPMGVHPDFQKLGLSQALMLEGFRRVAAHGAETAQVETYSFSEPAIAAYEAAGFQVVKRKLKFYKDY